MIHVRVNEVSGCWEWRGAVKPNGYGTLMVDGRRVYAHRYLYERVVGPIPEGLQMDHLCRNRACVNPAHLEPVTQAENLRRSRERLQPKTHCPKGHAYTDENRRYRADGYYVCVECVRQKSRDYQRRRRAAAKEQRSWTS